jgi:flavodoxin
MRKAFKIIIAIFALLVILVIGFGAIIILDVASFTATGSETLTPTDTAIGKALVAYDPGLSGTAKNVATKIASDLQANGYTVDLAGIKSPTAANTSSYNIVVVGGPIYAGTPTTSVKDFLSNLNPAQDAKIGIFGSGQGATTPEDVKQISDAIAGLANGGSLANAVIVKIGSSEDLSFRCTDFVNQLIG